MTTPRPSSHRSSSHRSSLTVQVLLALLAGLGLGLFASTQNLPWLQTLLSIITPLGTLFVNGIRMTIIPLVVSSLIVGIAAAPDARTIGRLGGRALTFMVLSVAAASILGVTMSTLAFNAMPIDAAATATLRASVTGTAATAPSAVPTFSQWLTDLVPANPVKSAADGAMLPLILFSVAFGIAVTRIETTRRASLVRGLEAVQETSLTLVRWVLVLAPIGVFALAAPLAAKLGVGALGALASYIGVVVALSIVLMLLLYPVASTLGRVPLMQFARAALPAQAMAFSGRSSLAALPAMITATRDTLALPPAIAGFVVPLLTTTFRIGAGVAQTTAVVFVAHLYGVTLAPAQLVTLAVTSVIASFSIPGIPGGTIVSMVPVLMSAGVPVEGVGILLGVDTIPDMFRTTANVTGHMTAAVVLGDAERRDAERRDAASVLVTGAH